MPHSVTKSRYGVDKSLVHVQCAGPAIQRKYVLYFSRVAIITIVLV